MICRRGRLDTALGSVVASVVGSLLASVVGTVVARVVGTVLGTVIGTVLGTVIGTVLGTVIGPVLAAATLLPAAAAQEPAGQRDDDPFGLRAPTTRAEQLAAAAAAHMDEVGGALAALSLRRRPARAFELGWSGSAGHAGEFDGGGGSAWVADLRRGSSALLTHPTHHFAPVDRATRDWLRGWTEAEILLATAPRTTLDPAWYVEGLVASLRAHALDARGEPVQRARALCDVLAAIPGVLAGARTTLEASRAEWSVHAAEIAFDLVLFLQDERVVRAAADAPAELAREVDAARRGAAVAARAYADHLVAKRGVRDPWRMNGSAWYAAVRALSGTGLRLEEIEATLLRDVAELRRLVERVGTDAGSADALPVDAELDLVLVVRDVRAACVVANHVAVAAQILPAPLPLLEVRASAAVLRTGPIVADAIASNGALALDVHGPAAHWTAAERATRTALLDAPGRVALGVRHGPAGEAALRTRIAHAAPNGIAAIPNRCAIAGLGLYATDWVLRVDVEPNPLRAPQVVRALRRERLVEAARLLAALRLHAQNAPVREVELELARLTELDAETARREVARAARDPMRGIGYLGYVELCALERALAQGADRERAVARTFGAALAFPFARVADLLPNLGPEGERGRNRIPWRDARSAYDE